jgi:hypothetical protein
VNFEREWSPFTHDDKTYALSHLNEDAFDFAIPGADPVRIIILYSHHCFTRDTKEGDHPALDFTRHHTEPRTFCFRRYALSLGLPAAIAAAKTGKVSMTRHPQSYFKVQAADLDGEMVDYQFGFTLDREGGKRRLIMRIRTACAKDDGWPEREQGTVKFAQLVKMRLGSKHPPRIYR